MLIPLKKLMDRFKFKPTGVIHVGGNIGEEAIQYANAGIEKVIWIEANPGIFTKLQGNIKGYRGHTAVLACVGDEDGKEVMFHVANNAGQSSSYFDLGTHKNQHPEVKYVEDIPMTLQRIDSLGLDLNGVDYLSMDLQGSEYPALRGMGDILRQLKYAYLEINRADVYKGCAQVNDIDLFMNGFGFKRVATEWCGGWGDGFFIKRL
jgi:FkbM family methyltransferase